ncbi:MAG: hypothetical protein IPL08_00760 [Saprospiraceae bacterium]|nr:hypothetical protein [Saprospiraceae bacterium]MBK8668027.1 hypothetical protein [Saprospiraceae bacterium]
MYKINHINGDCVESDNTVEGAVPAIGPEGQIYNKSNDQGTTWKEEETKIDPIWEPHEKHNFNIHDLKKINTVLHELLT